MSANPRGAEPFFQWYNFVGFLCVKEK